jgi:hypothetical protein
MKPLLSSRTRPSLLLRGFLSIGLIIAPSGALAWGELGHRLTAMVAWQALTPAAREQVLLLHPDVDFAALSTQMDRERPSLMRRYPGSAGWHYVNQSVCNPQSPPVCPRGHCASHQIERWQAILADPAEPQARRADALAFLVHMIGDIHQPLHTASHQDRGGNDVKVSGAGPASLTLHQVWDSALVTRAVGQLPPEKWVLRAVAARRAKHVQWSSGTSMEWIAESARLARKSVYDGLPGFSCDAPMPPRVKVDDAWLARGTALVPERIVKAGLRIAATINTALAPDKQPAAQTDERMP